MPRAIATALLASLALAGTASAQHIIGTRDARALRVDSVFATFDRSDSPGCAVGVYQEGKLTYGRGYGMANLTHGIALSPRSVLDIGSISKQFTAMAILLLEKEGKLSLDDPLRKHFPEMPAYADGVTLRRALSQTSGLRDLWVMWQETGRTFRGDTIDALRIITRAAEPNYTPGDRYLYTNSGWILAAQLVYRLTGKTLADFAEERIFAPLGMRDTRYLVDRQAVIPNLAESYAPRGNGYRDSRNNYDGAIMGAGGVHTTIEDFGKWLNNFDEGTVGGRDVIARLTTATTLNNGSPAQSGATQAYAIGVNVGTVRGLRTVSHGGSWQGFRAHFLRFPEQRFAVATFCNVSNGGPDSLARRVAEIHLGDKMQPDSARLWTVALAGEPRAADAGTSVGSLVGVWRNVERGEVRRFRLAGDTLISDIGQRTVLVPLAGERFRAGRGNLLTLERGSGGAPSRLVVRTGTDTTVFTRADTAALTPAKLAEYVGEYRNDEVETTQSWKVEEGKIAVYASGRRIGVLDPTYRDGFMRGGAVIDVTRDGRGRITGFVVENGRVRGLRFTRVR